MIKITTLVCVIHLLISGKQLIMLDYLLAINVLLYTMTVSGQECMDTVGCLSHDSNIVTQGQTFILAGYTIPCDKTVIAWEFCYRISRGSVTFYPGIWMITRTMGNPDYELIQSNSVTYDQSIQTSGNDACQRVDLTTTDQFIAPAKSVVGLYSNVQTQLLFTNTNSSITTYQISGNQSSVRTVPITDVNYNIAIRVHLGKHFNIANSLNVAYLYNYICSYYAYTYHIPGTNMLNHFLI